MQLYFNKQARSNLKAVKASGAIKKDECVLLQQPDLVKPEARQTSPISNALNL